MRGKQIVHPPQLNLLPSRKKIKLGEALEKPEIDGNYPHTVGFYKVSSGRGANFKPEYLELRRIQNVEEFWLFLNALDI